MAGNQTLFYGAYLYLNISTNVCFFRRGIFFSNELFLELLEACFHYSVRVLLLISSPYGPYVGLFLCLLVFQSFPRLFVLFNNAKKKAETKTHF